MNRSLLGLAAAILFVAPQLGSHGSAQALGGPLSFRLNGLSSRLVYYAPARVKVVKICVRNGGPVDVRVRSQTYQVSRGTCKARNTNLALGRRPKRTTFRLSLPENVSKATGWIEYKF